MGCLRTKLFWLWMSAFRIVFNWHVGKCLRRLIQVCYWSVCIWVMSFARVKQSPFVQPGIRLDPHLKLCKFQLETDCSMHSQSFIVTLNANGLALPTQALHFKLKCFSVALIALCSIALGPLYTRFICTDKSIKKLAIYNRLYARL